METSIQVKRETMTPLARRIMRRIYLIWAVRRYGIRVVPLVIVLAVIAFFLARLVFWANVVGNLQEVGDLSGAGSFLWFAFWHTSEPVRALLAGGLLGSLFVLHDLLVVLRGTIYGEAPKL